MKTNCNNTEKITGFVFIPKPKKDLLSAKIQRHLQINSLIKNGMNKDKAKELLDLVYGKVK